MYFTLGVEVTGTDPQVLIKVNLNKPTPQVQATSTPTVPELEDQLEGVMKVDYSTLQPLEIIQMAT
ncbi:hypothetical protein XENOCAPTIV_027686, partial [Xenoophorus captivus]